MLSSTLEILDLTTVNELFPSCLKSDTGACQFGNPFYLFRTSSGPRKHNHNDKDDSSTIIPTRSTLDRDIAIHHGRQWDMPQPQLARPSFL